MIVYTVITGGYDTLLKTKFPSICLSDKQIKRTSGWELRTIPLANDDLRRASRHPKMMPDRYFPNAVCSLYIDGNIRLIRDPSDLVAKYLKDTDMALFMHPQRRCIYKEAREVVRRRKADPKTVSRQIAYYKKQGFPENYGLTACWVILRRHTPSVRRFGAVWWEEYLRYSCRDQLCFDYARWKTGIAYTMLPGNLLKNESKYFRRVKHA